MALIVHIDSLCQSIGAEAAIEWRERRLKLLRKTGVTAVNQATPLYLIVKNSGGDMLKPTENYFTMQAKVPHFKLYGFSFPHRFNSNKMLINKAAEL